MGDHIEAYDTSHKIWWYKDNILNISFGYSNTGSQTPYICGFVRVLRLCHYWVFILPLSTFWSYTFPLKYLTIIPLQLLKYFPISFILILLYCIILIQTLWHYHIFMIIEDPLNKPHIYYGLPHVWLPPGYRCQGGEPIF